VVGAKFLLAGIMLALVGAATAGADKPTVRISAADQATAQAALLRLKDFGPGWTGGPRKAEKLTAPKCPGFDPKESDLTVTGHAEARYTYPGQVGFDQDVQVLESHKAVMTDFSRVIGPKLATCLAYQLKSSPQVLSASVARLRFPKLGNTSAAYRATVVVKVAGHKINLVRDYIFLGKGRVEFSLAFEAPAKLGGELLSFEQAIAQKLVQRVGANVA
jgi:hypothetical protein